MTTQINSKPSEAIMKNENAKASIILVHGAWADGSGGVDFWRTN